MSLSLSLSFSVCLCVLLSILLSYVRYANVFQLCSIQQNQGIGILIKLFEYFSECGYKALIDAIDAIGSACQLAHNRTGQTGFVCFDWKIVAPCPLAYTFLHRSPYGVIHSSLPIQVKVYLFLFFFCTFIRLTSFLI